MIRKIITICFITLFLFTMAGCIDAEKIESEEEAREAVLDISEDLSDISDTLEEIDEDLG